ncbi:MAG: FAD:protein FMN transferase [Planctomycetes bacterium]|nr:FAD:protein FMN transferase [Planctomycetota bacterium]
MNQEKLPFGNRREFLTGRTLRQDLEILDAVTPDEIPVETKLSNIPVGGATVRLSTRAMACDFSIIMNPGPGDRVMPASNALDLIHVLEDQMSVYRESSELSQINSRAINQDVTVEPKLFNLLLESARICRKTGAGFDPTSGPLIALWRRCRQDGRIPTENEITHCLRHTGLEHVTFEEQNQTVRFDQPGVELDLGGIGKGYALDRGGELLLKEGLEDWLFHGGHSSILARGDHNGCGGWPVGIRNPLFPKQRLATILLKNCALSSSGSGVQHFRHAGKRYGHILDPRTGSPVEGMLSVTVLAPTAAEADALSTAFFVIGVENTLMHCDNRDDLSVLLIPPPRHGRTLEPVVCGMPDGVLFFTPDET